MGSSEISPDRVTITFHCLDNIKLWRPGDLHRLYMELVNVLKHWDLKCAEIEFGSRQGQDRTEEE